MSDLTADLNRSVKGNIHTLKVPLGAVHVYKGDGLMVLRGTGYAIKMANTALGTYIGVAMEEVDNSGGSAGDLEVLVRRGGIERFSKTSAAITDVGVMATAVDSTTVATGGTKNVQVGLIVKHESTTHVWVDTSIQLAASEAS
jgi:hypothetical protein